MRPDECYSYSIITSHTHISSSGILSLDMAMYWPHKNLLNKRWKPDALRPTSKQIWYGKNASVRNIINEFRKSRISLHDWNVFLAEDSTMTNCPRPVVYYNWQFFYDALSTTTASPVNQVPSTIANSPFNVTSSAMTDCVSNNFPQQQWRMILFYL